MLLKNSELGPSRSNCWLAVAWPRRRGHDWATTASSPRLQALVALPDARAQMPSRLPAAVAWTLCSTASTTTGKQRSWRRCAEAIRGSQLLTSIEAPEQVLSADCAVPGRCKWTSAGRSDAGARMAKRHGRVGADWCRVSRVVCGRASGLEEAPLARLMVCAMERAVGA